MFKPRPWRRKGEYVKCSICDIVFYTKKSDKGKYCSRKCYWKSLEGKPSWNKGRKWPEQSGKNHPRFVGRIKSVDGYIWILKPDHPFAMRGQYVYEHRLVVEKEIGRYLNSEEVVHHEGKKDDNRLKKLIVFKNKSFHNQFHSGKKVDACNIIFDGRKI